jgi:guanosine-3',5'-bis(diphosphate) 3'-pyrophosphohydrolase
MFDEYHLVQKVSSYNPNSRRDLLIKALQFAKRAHMSQVRASGEPYFMHPLAVANILADLKLDDETIITGILHDTVEDTVVTSDTIKQEFGEEIAGLVDGVTKLNKIEFQPENIRQAENFRKLLLAMSKDIRILLVKICDRLHNMRTIDHIKTKAKRARIAQETLEIFAPLTERIGVHRLKDELEDLSFKELHSDVRQSIIHRLDFLKKQTDKNIINKIISDLEDLFRKKGLKCKIYGRSKKPYSIWRKMQRKNISFEQLSDIMAFRVIVDNVDECYRALGVVHAEYHSISHSFKDFISTPKANGYQSLHSTVIGPEKHKIEVQIRTAEMHNVAEYGIAAHWCYKQGVDTKKYDTNYRWIQELLSILEYSSDPEEFIRNTRFEIYQDQVFCFTPMGKLIALPQGGTPVDFAYAIHSDVGNSCVGVKVNGVMGSLRQVLSNGDQVDIITSKTQTPSEDWEDYVVTGKAKMQIRKYVRQQKRETYAEDGKLMLSELFNARKKEFSEEKIKKILNIFSKDNLEDLYISIGENLISLEDVYKTCFPEDVKEIKKSKFLSIFKKRKLRKKSNLKAAQNSNIIKDVISGTQISFAGCCYPIPKDKIVGVLHPSKGITVHRAICKNIKYSSKDDNFMKLSWSTKIDSKFLFISKIKVLLVNNLGSFAKVTKTIADKKVDIDDIKVTHKNSDHYEVLIDVRIQNINKLRELKAELRSSEDILSIERVI